MIKFPFEWIRNSLWEGNLQSGLSILFHSGCLLSFFFHCVLLCVFFFIFIVFDHSNFRSVTMDVVCVCCEYGLLNLLIVFFSRASSSFFSFRLLFEFLLFSQEGLNDTILYKTISFPCRICTLYISLNAKQDGIIDKCSHRIGMPFYSIGIDEMGMIAPLIYHWTRKNWNFEFERRTKMGRR